MKTLALSAALLIATSAAHADDLPLLEAGYQTLAALDLGTTIDGIHEHDQGRFRYEQNPMLGRHPTEAKVLTYFVLTDVAHAVLAFELQSHGHPVAARAWEYVSIGFEAGAAGHNLALGLRVRL